MYRFFLFFFFLNNICATRYRERSVSETRPVFFFSNPPLPPPLSSQGTISLTPDASSGGIAWRTYRVSEVVEQVEKSPTVVYPNQDGRKTLYLFPFPSLLSFSLLFFFSFSSSNQGHRRPSSSFLKRGHPVLFQGISEVHDLVTLGRVIRIIVTVRGNTRVRAETAVYMCVCIHVYIRILLLRNYAIVSTGT